MPSIFSACSIATDFTITLDYHSHFIKFQGKPTSFSFSIQLWNLVEFKNATMKIALSVFPFPLSGEVLYNFKTGIELVIKNGGIGFIGSKGEVSRLTFKIHYFFMLTYTSNHFHFLGGFGPIDQQCNNMYTSLERY